MVREECGVTPKEYQRIARFSASRARLAGARRRGRASIASVAAASGYADQAHLTREWQSLAGLHAHDVAAHGVPIPSRPGRPVGGRLRRSPTKGPTMTGIGLWPTLSFRDADAMIAWLEAIGFTDPHVYRDEQDPTQVAHAEMRWPGGGGIMFGSHREGNDVVSPARPRRGVPRHRRPGQGRSPRRSRPAAPCADRWSTRTTAAAAAASPTPRATPGRSATTARLRWAARRPAPPR